MADKGIGNIIANVFYTESKSVWKGQLNYTPAATLENSSGEGWIFGQKSVTTNVNEDYFESAQELVQNGDAPGTSATWTERDSNGGTDGFSVFGDDANPITFDKAQNINSSAINTLTANANGGFIVAGKHYTVKFKVQVANLNITIGSGDLSGNSMDTEEVAAATYAVASNAHGVEFTATASATHLWIQVNHSASAGNGTLDDFSLQSGSNVIIGNALDVPVDKTDQVLWMAVKVEQGDGTHGILLDFRGDDDVGWNEEKCIVVGPGEVWIGKPCRTLVGSIHSESVVIDSNGDVTGDGTQTVETHFGAIIKNVA